MQMGCSQLDDGVDDQGTGALASPFVVDVALLLLALHANHRCVIVSPAGATTTSFLCLQTLAVGFPSPNPCSLFLLLLLLPLETPVRHR